MHISLRRALVGPIRRALRGNAYSPDHADLRPSSLLLSYVIEKAAEEGIEVIDMLRGEEPYKRIWHADPVPTYKFSMPRVAHHAQPLAA
ncbi:MAG TPA: GNAT family N-acetyltransferase [Acidobacteriaceae bacterium]|nr:GNAT family N-acetyltransferase [Acidobacteriaceae bacterium]